MAEQLEIFGNEAETYFVLGAGHEFYGTDNGNWDSEPNQYWDSVFNKVEDFSLWVHKPTAGFVITQFENVAMFADTSKKATNWVWDFGDGTYSTEQNPAHEYVQPGMFTVIQFASNDLISWDTASAFAYSFVGMAEKKADFVKVYPNPATDFIQIQNTGMKSFHVQISTSKGKTVESFNLGAGITKNISLFGLQKGVYFIVFQSGKEVFVRRIIYL